MSKFSHHLALLAALGQGTADVIEAYSRIRDRRLAFEEGWARVDDRMENACVLYPTPDFVRPTIVEHQ